MSLCVCHFLSIPSPSSSPLPQLHHTGCFAFLKTSVAAWKGTRPRGAGKCWVAGGGTEDVCVIALLAAGLTVVPSWGNQAHVTLAQPLANTCCHQNGDDALAPAFQQLLTRGRYKDACANQLSQLTLPIIWWTAAVSLNQKNWVFFKLRRFYR